MALYASSPATNKSEGGFWTYSGAVPRWSGNLSLALRCACLCVRVAGAHMHVCSSVCVLAQTFVCVSVCIHVCVCVWMSFSALRLCTCCFNLRKTLWCVFMSCNIWAHSQIRAQLLVSHRLGIWSRQRLLIHNFHKSQFPALIHHQGWPIAIQLWPKTFRY